MKESTTSDLLKQCTKKLNNITCLVHALSDMPHMTSWMQLHKIANDLETEAKCLRVVLKPQ